MPSEIMQQQGLFPSSFFSEDICFANEVGFRRSEAMLDQRTCKKSIASSPLEKIIQMEPQKKSLHHLGSFATQDERRNLSLDVRAVGAERKAKQSFPLLGSMDLYPGTRSSLNGCEASYFDDGQKVNTATAQHENSLFSSSLSDLISREMILSSSSAPYGHSTETTLSHSEEDEPLESLEEIEAQTIGNLLPSDDDLFSGVNDGLDLSLHPKNTEDAEELDLFSSVGGIELGDDAFSTIHKGSEPHRDVTNGRLRTCGAPVSSKPLLAKNIDNKNGDFDIANGESLGVNSVIQSPLVDPMLNHRISSGVLTSFPSLMSTGSIGKLSTFSESDHLQGQLKYDAQGPTESQACSLPEYHHSFTKCPHPNASSPIATKTKAENLESSRLCTLNQNGQAFHLSEGVFASGSNGNHLHPGYCDTWSNSYNSLLSPVMWPNSPSVRNGISTSHSQTQQHGLPRVPSLVLNSVSSMHIHHAGSAPTITHPLWERRHSFTAQSPDSPGINPGSLGSLRVPSRSHYMDFTSCNIVPHGCGNCMELANALRSVGLQSPQTSPTVYNGRGLQSPQASPTMYNGRGLQSPQASPTMYNGRGLHSPQTSPTIYIGRGQAQTMISGDSPHERSRSRRNEGSINQADKKQFELDIDRIVSGEDKRTTLMIKNIPNKYTSKMLLAAIDERHRGTYDFIYLPIDFKNKCNVGYAFINMTDPSHIIPFYEAFDGKKWEKFNSEKVASLAYARIQGKAALVAHFQNSSLMNEDKRCRPILFNTDGPNAGDQVPFPMGVNVRTRPGRAQKSDS